MTSFPINIRIAVIRRRKLNPSGFAYFEYWPMSDIADRKQYGMGAGGFTEIHVW